MQNEKDSGRINMDNHRGGGGGGAVNRCKNRKEGAPYGSYAVLAAAVTVMIFITYLQLFPWRIVTFDSEKIQLSKHIYKQGEVIPLKYPFTKHTNIVPTILTRMHNDIIYQLPAYSGSIGVGRMDKWTYSAEIPRHLPPGRYRLERVFIYDINFLRQETYRLMTDEFEVVK